MYQVIGADGRQYGPATADQVRLWIRQRRVERQTPLLAPGAAAWTTAGLQPEFAGDFPPPGAPPVIHPPPAAPMSPAPSRSMAKAGLLCGILSVTVACCCGGLPFNILGFVFSVVALIQIGENPQRYGGRDLALLGLILSALGFVILTVAALLG